MDYVTKLKSELRNRSHKGCNLDISMLDLTLVTVKLKITVCHNCGFIMLTKKLCIYFLI